MNLFPTVFALLLSAGPDPVSGATGSTSQAGPSPSPTLHDCTVCCVEFEVDPALRKALEDGGCCHADKYCNRCWATLIQSDIKPSGDTPPRFPRCTRCRDDWQAKQKEKEAANPSTATVPPAKQAAGRVAGPATAKQAAKAVAKAPTVVGRPGPSEWMGRIWCAEDILKLLLAKLEPGVLHADILKKFEEVDSHVCIRSCLEGSAQCNGSVPKVGIDVVPRFWLGECTLLITVVVILEFIIRVVDQLHTALPLEPRLHE